MIIGRIIFENKIKIAELMCLSFINITGTANGAMKIIIIKILIRLFFSFYNFVVPSVAPSAISR